MGDNGEKRSRNAMTQSDFMRYVEKHHLHKLFSELMTDCFAQRVENPIKFITQRLSGISEQQSNKYNEKLKKELKAMKVERNELKAKLECLKQQQKICDKVKIKAEKRSADFDGENSLVKITKTLSIDETAGPPSKRKTFNRIFECSFDETAEFTEKKVKKENLKAVDISSILVFNIDSDV